MGSFSNYLENEALDHLLGTAYTAPTTVYLALCTATVVDTDTGSTITETTYGTYARQAITFAAAAKVSTDRRIAQTGSVAFPQAADSGGTVTDWAVLDASTAGNLLAYGTFATSKAIVSGNTPSTASGEVYVEFSTGGISDYAALAFLDLAFRNQAFAAPTTYVALTTATIADTNTGATITEVANANGYAREVVNLAGGASPAWTAAASGAADNAAAITFTTATGSWGTVVATCLIDSATHGAGNMIFYDNGMSDQAVTTDDTVNFPIGTYDVAVT